MPDELARRDAEPAEHRGPLAGADPAAPVRHGGAAAGSHRAPGVRLRGRAGQAPGRRRRGPLRIPARLGRPARSTATRSWARHRSRSGDGERIDLGRNRSALRVPVSLPSGARAELRRHAPAPPRRRRGGTGGAGDGPDRMAGSASTGPLVVVGDFNAEPVESTYRVMLDAGFRSASAEANGAEPAVTWPSGIQAPGMDVDGEPGCLDYIWVRGQITVDRVPARVRSTGGRRPDALPVGPLRAQRPDPHRG